MPQKRKRRRRPTRLRLPDFSKFPIRYLKSFYTTAESGIKSGVNVSYWEMRQQGLIREARRRGINIFE